MKNRSAETADECFRLCIRVGRLAYNWLARGLERAGLTPVQFEVLDLLADAERGLSLGELREHMCCAGSNVTAVVDRLERDGLVVRRADRRDRRVKRTRATAAARRRLREVTPTSGCCPELTGVLSTAEIRQLASFLRPLAERLAGTRGASAGVDRTAAERPYPGTRRARARARSRATRHANVSA